jgi:outer membrane protein assembly factor BamD
VANYYFQRGAYLAAANRGRYVLENFQRTPAVADALAIMVQAYTLLGMEEAAKESLTVLKQNYPDHPSIRSGEFVMNLNPQRSWINIATLGLIDPPPAPGFDSRAVKH